MNLTKLEKFLLFVANIVYFLYIIFSIIWIQSFREYASTDYLRVKLVDQIREQTRLTMDSANISTKDLNYIFEIMGKLSYLYVAVFILLLLILVFLQFKFKSLYLFGFVLLVYSIAILIFTIGILFISCIIYFFVGLKLILQAKRRAIS
ncbi:hypothetical protein HZY83_07630 [Gemella sp. GH3]|uniref:hypothetical protein n=1 Tax=unclassified Gemella TaxID=2624949 RepID=UPI0015D0CD54|nr:MULTISPECIES: hypothetical protein [unclassified Gemella]MBF0714545.1 hypothetical protein [Gemella sp. GH3.1]NYS51497.1 hypothetical protein [Gemella sp. GH3]